MSFVAETVNWTNSGPVKAVIKVPGAITYAFSWETFRYSIEVLL